MTKRCKWCDKPIPEGANPRALYCPPEQGEDKSKCKASAENHRFYERHKDRIIAATLANRAKNSPFKTPLGGEELSGQYRRQKARILEIGSSDPTRDFIRGKDQGLDFDQMSNDELLEFVRNNPDQMRVGKRRK